MTEKTAVPLDDHALELLLEAMNSAYEVDEHGNHTVVNGEFTVTRLLDFWSGYDARIEVPTVLTRDDVIRALIEEVKALRAANA